MASQLVEKYMRVDRLPHIWCAGCGNGQVINGLIRAIDKAGLDQERTVVISGVGCAGRASGHMNFDTLHALHGRVLAFATGMRLSKPELSVIAIMGDGDCAAIGGNHFIHAARRNIDVTALVINNKVYGMTGGQYSPTTPMNAVAATAFYGNVEPEFDLCTVAEAAGATFVARAVPARMPELIGILVKAIQHRGFSFVEVVAQCPTYFGRPNNEGGPVEMLKRQKGLAVPLRVAKERPEAAEGKLVTGVLRDVERPTFEDLYAQVRQRASANGKESQA